MALRSIPAGKYKSRNAEHIFPDKELRGIAAGICTSMISANAVLDLSREIQRERERERELLQIAAGNYI